MNKKVLVVGASGGIGNNVAETLLELGYKVYGTYNEHPENLQNLEAKDNFKKHHIDLSDIDSIKSCISEIGNGGLFGMVNCAGVVEFEGDTFEDDANIWKRTISINLTGNFLLAKLLQSKLVSEGKFIMISSTDANFGGAITASYAASKAGVDSLTKSISLLYKDKRVNVNTIAPGWVVTPMMEENGDEFIEKVSTINPLGRNAIPLDVANLVEFLLSEKSNYINGQIIRLDGGYTNQDPTLLLEEDVKS